MTGQKIRHGIGKSPAALGPHLFYPIVPDAAWVARLAPLGVRTIQLRLKNASPDEVRRQIGESLEVTARHGCDLIVNDDWRAAIDLGAIWVHLGQEDLADADIPAIRAAGIRLGLSTHDEQELATALAVRPDYVALGPIFETRLKAMLFAPQGLARIGDWRAKIGALPLVAIGGITLKSAPAVHAAGADSIAVVSDIVAHPDPEAHVAAWLAWAERPRATLRERSESKAAPRVLKKRK